MAMTARERMMFNEALAKVQAFKWEQVTTRRLGYLLDRLAPSDKIALLRKIDEVLGVK